MPRGPIHKPNKQTKHDVKMLKAFGITHAHIADHLGISHDTLEKYYRHEIDHGLNEANIKVANVLFELCTVKKDRASVMFWLKTRGGWREKDFDDEGKVKTIIESLLDKIPDASHG